jgi:EmrB/QacA subfamily drug resistance transporter
MSSVTTQNHTPASPPTTDPSPLPPSPRRSAHTDLPTDLPPDAGRAAAGIAIVLVAQLMLVLDASVVNVGLPRIDADLAFGPAGLSWVLNAYTLAFGGLLLLGGRLGDVLGRRRMFEIGIAVFTLASVSGGLAQSPGWLVASRALQGVGAAMAAPGVLALLTTSAPDEAARNRALALFGAVTSGGLSIGLILGGIVTDLGSWRWTLFINVPIGLALLALTRRFLAETPRRPGRFDIVGAVTATLGAVSIVWALIGTPDHGWWSVRTVGGFLVGAVLLTVLFFTERRVAHPMLQPALLRNRNRLGGLGVMMLVVGGQFSMFFLVVQYTQRVLGFGPLLSGMAFLPLTLGIFAMSRVTPRLLPRFGARAMMITGTTGMAISFTWLAIVGSADGTGSYAATILGPMLLNGFSAGLVFMPVTSTILRDVEPEHAGSASGLLQTAQQLGGAIGLAVIASVYAARAVPGQFMPGLTGAFLTSATMAVLALLLAALVLRPRARS